MKNVKKIHKYATNNYPWVIKLWEIFVFFKISSMWSKISSMNIHCLLLYNWKTTLCMPLKKNNEVVFKASIQTWPPSEPITELPASFSVDPLAGMRQKEPRLEVCQLCAELWSCPPSRPPSPGQCTHSLFLKVSWRPKRNLGCRHASEPVTHLYMGGNTNTQVKKSSSQLQLITIYKSLEQALYHF